MISDRFELLPGVWLNLVQTDRFKTGCFSINFLRPLSQADAASNALLPSVLLRGCRNTPDMRAISQRLDTLYGASVGTLIRKKGEVQSVGLYADFLEDRYAGGEPVFAQMMEFVRELMFEPCLSDGGFLPDFVEGERRNLVNTIDARINDKRSYAIGRLLKAMCAGEAYATPRLGEKAPLAVENGQSLYARWRDMLTQSRVELFYLGQQPREAVVDALTQMLAELPRAAVQTATPTKILLPQRQVQKVGETLDVTQGKLAIGLRTPVTIHDSRYPAMMLLDAVYGAGMTSKLFLKIREEQSLCYYAYASMDKFKGIMLVEAGIESSNYQVALDGILEQLACCQRGGITSQELESARTYLLSALRTGKDSPGRLDDYAIGQSIAGLNGTMDDLAAQLRSVTLEQVVEAAGTLALDTVYFLKGVEA